MGKKGKIEHQEESFFVNFFSSSSINISFPNSANKTLKITYLTSAEKIMIFKRGNDYQENIHSRKKTKMKGLRLF